MPADGRSTQMLRFDNDAGALKTVSHNARVVAASNHSPPRDTTPFPVLGMRGTSFRARPTVSVYGPNPISSAYPPEVRLKKNGRSGNASRIIYRTNKSARSRPE